MSNKRVPKRLVATVNQEAFKQIKIALVGRAIPAQEAIILALIEYLGLDITLDQATNFKEEDVDDE